MYYSVHLSGNQYVAYMLICEKDIPEKGLLCEQISGLMSLRARTRMGVTSENINTGGEHPRFVNNNPPFFLEWIGINLSN